MGNKETAIKNLKKATGRPKGKKNKFTVDLKAAYMEAFEQRGGVKGLLEWAEKSPDIFYGQVSKMLPKEIAATIDDKRDPPNVTLVVENKCRKI